MDIKTTKGILDNRVEKLIEEAPEVDGVKFIPFMTLEWMDDIVEEMLRFHTLEGRETALIAGVLNYCTDVVETMEENKEDDIGYISMVYSGFWDEVMEKYPILKKNVEQIREEVVRRESTQYILNEFTKQISESFTKAVNGFDTDKIGTAINNFAPKIEKMIQGIDK